MNTLTLDTQLARIKAHEKRGELFAAIDEAERYLSQYDTAPLALRHRTVLLMARAGALNHANKRYEDLQLDTEHDPEARTLGARLLKDTAFSCAQAEQHHALENAAKAYREIYEETDDAYPGINAATLAVLIADRETATKIAQQILKKAMRDAGQKTDY